MIVNYYKSMDAARRARRLHSIIIIRFIASNKRRRIPPGDADATKDHARSAVHSLFKIKVNIMVKHGWCYFFKLGIQIRRMSLLILRILLLGYRMSVIEKQ